MTDLGLARLYLLFTPSSCRRDPWWTLRDALDGGVDLVQWRVREPDVAGARRCLQCCAECGVPMIVNDHVALAAELGAAGAHVGQHDLAAAAARALLGPGQRLGVSTHSLVEIDAALAAGADHLGFGPMFPTATKGYARGQPPGALAAALEFVRRCEPEVPIFAIGGIDIDRIPALRAEGVRRIAVSSTILAAADPGRRAAELRAALER